MHKNGEKITACVNYFTPFFLLLKPLFTHRCSKTHDFSVITFDFDDFAKIKYGDIPVEAFSFGSNLVHELGHAHGGLKDPPRKEANTTTGDTVDLVNEIRSERGLPLRAVYGVKSHGMNARGIKMGFKGLKGKKPEKIFYIKAKDVR